MFDQIHWQAENVSDNVDWSIPFGGGRYWIWIRSAAKWIQFIRSCAAFHIGKSTTRLHSIHRYHAVEFLYILQRKLVGLAAIVRSLSIQVSGFSIERHFHSRKKNLAKKKLSDLGKKDRFLDKLNISFIFQNSWCSDWTHRSAKLCAEFY